MSVYDATVVIELCQIIAILEPKKQCITNVQDERRDSLRLHIGYHTVLPSLIKIFSEVLSIRDDWCPGKKQYIPWNVHFSRPMTNSLALIGCEHFVICIAFFFLQDCLEAVNNSISLLFHFFIQHKLHVKHKICWKDHIPNLRTCRWKRVWHPFGRDQ